MNLFVALGLPNVAYGLVLSAAVSSLVHAILWYFDFSMLPLISILLAYPLGWFFGGSGQWSFGAGYATALGGVIGHALVGYLFVSSWTYAVLISNILLGVLGGHIGVLSEL